MRKLLVTLLVLGGATIARGQQPLDLIDLMAVDVVTRGGQNVLYKNGEKLGRRQAKLILHMHPDALQTLKKAYRHRAVGNSFMAVGTAFAGGGVGVLCSGESWAAGVGLIAVGGIFFGSGVPFIKAYNRHSDKAVEIYNREVFRNAVPRRGVDLSFGPTRSGGLGLTLVF